MGKKKRYISTPELKKRIKKKTTEEIERPEGEGKGKGATYHYEAEEFRGQARVLPSQLSFGIKQRAEGKYCGDVEGKRKRMGCMYWRNRTKGGTCKEMHCNLFGKTARGKKELETVK